MDNLSWLDRVRRRLAGQALPPAYVCRFLEELSDHLEDLKEENMEADAFSRLGEAEEVAETAVVVFRRRSFLGRHPLAAFLVFAVSPLVWLIAALAMTIGVAGVIDWVLPWDCIEKYFRNLGPQGRRMLPYVLSVLFPMLPSVLGSMLHCKLARRLGLRRRCVVLSCVVLAAVGSLVIWTAKFSEIPGKSALMLGFGIPGRIVDLPEMCGCLLTNPLRLAQFLVPLIFGWLFVRHMRNNARFEVAA